MIIGISGKIGSGKDTVGQIISYLVLNDLYKEEDSYLGDQIKAPFSLNKDYTSFEGHSRNFKNKKFADKLKDITCLLIGCTREQLEDREFKEKELGEEWRVSLNDIEIWKPIPTYEGYLINNFGQIKSLDRKGSDGRFIKGVFKENHIGTNGYLACTISNKKGKKTWAVHQLIMWAFTKYSPSYYDCVINHIDNVKTNNCITNLEVVSSRYNSTVHKKPKSGEHGIYERNGKFEVTLRIKGKKTYLGTYTTIKEAIIIRNNKLIEIDNFKRIYLNSIIYTPRLLLQKIGTESMRDIIHPNIWVNSLMSEYKPNPLWGRESTKISELPNWIITDMRFLNELEAVKSKGGVTIRVNRGEGNTGNHPSETALDNAKFDYTIDNNSTIEELIEKVKEILIKEGVICK